MKHVQINADTLSQISGVSRAAIYNYLRRGLLPRGNPSKVTRWPLSRLIPLAWQARRLRDAAIEERSKHLRGDQ